MTATLLVSFSSVLACLAVSLSMNTAAFQKSASQMETRVSSMGTKFASMGKNLAGIGAALGGAAVLGGITSAVTSAFAMASALSEASEKIGLSVEGLQRLRTAAADTGISNDQLETSVGRLNTSMGNLQLGKDSAVSAFAAIGLSADDLKGKKPDEAMGMIADALNKIPDASTRAAAGAAIFGKGYKDLIPLINGGSDAIKKYADISKKQGEISGADAKKLDDLGDGWDRFKVRVGVVTATMIAGFAGFAEKVGASMSGLSESMVKVHDAVARMARGAVTWVNNMVTGISTAITGRLSAVWEKAKAGIESVRAGFENLYDKVQRNSYMPDMIAGIAEEFAKLQQIMVDPSLSAIGKVGGAFQSLGRLAGGIFGKKAGGILGALGSFASALGPLFGKGAPGPLYAGVNGDSLPGFARGGSGTFGGIGGVDKNILSMNGSPIARVSKGEHFRVSPNGGGGSRMHFDLRGAVMTHDLLRQMNQIGAVATVNGAQMGASGGHQATLQQQRRSIP